MDYLNKEMQDGFNIKYLSWDNVNNPKAIVLIVHGMQEHIKRYTRFAKALNESGYIVIGHNQRGHGNSVKSIDDLGFIESKEGWKILIEDIASMMKLAKERHPGLAVYVFGHSMGSFVAREYSAKYSGDINGLICSATGANPGMLGQIMLKVAQVQVLLKGPKSPSHLIDGINSKYFLKRLKAIRTNVDWLSRDINEVDKYVLDKYCGNVVSNRFYVDLFTSSINTNKRSVINKVRKDLAILLVSGDNDPIGNYGKGIKKVYKAMSTSGIIDLTMKLFEGGRHELLNEKNRDEVYKYIINWIDQRVALEEKWNSQKYW